MKFKKFLIIFALLITSGCTRTAQAQMLQIDSGNTKTSRGFYRMDQDYLNGSISISNSYGIGVWADLRYGIDINYKIPVENGTYYVMLYMKETNPAQKVGGRVFDISVNNQNMPGIDLFALHGFSNQFKIFKVTVTDYFININLHATKGNAVLSAIDILYDFPGLESYCNGPSDFYSLSGITDWYCRIPQMFLHPELY